MLTIAITMGDPYGIGPEIVVKALADRSVRESARFVIFGLNEQLAYAADLAEIEPFWWRAQHDAAPSHAWPREGVLVLDYDECSLELASPGHVGATRDAGAVSFQFVEDAITDSLLPADHPRHVDAIVTAPICKESWRLAHKNWPGHTELLAARYRAKRSAMMFVAPKLRVVLATIHMPLMDIRNVLTIGRVFDPIDLGHQACVDMGIKRPRIAVCGLNPHASEGGLFGDEEYRVISPAIELARNHGIDAVGPFPADTIFGAAVAGKYDLVVAMYHDQGLIPVKLLAWDCAVNTTLGLPVVRTSPDHGTAFDIAGTGQANPGSMVAAIKLAIDLATARQRGG
ncbi:MAG: 4-hydroxythreonine-4-phosphate dehydrogenase PdxA [Phycisphaerales bacterium]|nr:4-hydroxythreonine-4-phosphate dehydrogenase PdxA [Phycisphaerales bacterium]